MVIVNRGLVNREASSICNAPDGKFLRTILTAFAVSFRDIRIDPIFKEIDSASAHGRCPHRITARR
jgi:hypothetical protein